MAPKVSKGQVVASFSHQGQKHSWTGQSSNANLAAPSASQIARCRFGVKWVEKDSVQWYKDNKEAQYQPTDVIDKDSLARHYLRI